LPEFLNPADDRKVYVGYPYGGLALTHFVGVSGIEDIKDGRNFVAAKLPRSDPRAGVFGYEDIAKINEIRDGTSNTIMIIGSGELACPWVQSGGSTIRGARAPYFGELTGFGSKSDRGKGAIAMMADGSVRWISADVDEQVFRAMCTIAGGEAVNANMLGRGNVPQRRFHAARRDAKPTEELNLWQLMQQGQ